MSLTKRNLDTLTKEFARRMKFICTSKGLEFNRLGKYLTGAKTAKEARSDASISQMITNRYWLEKFIVEEIRNTVEEFGGNLFDVIQFEMHIQKTFGWQFRGINIAIKLE